MKEVRYCCPGCGRSSDKMQMTKQWNKSSSYGVKKFPFTHTEKLLCRCWKLLSWEDMDEVSKEIT